MKNPKLVFCLVQYRLFANRTYSELFLSNVLIVFHFFDLKQSLGALFADRNPKIGHRATGGIGVPPRGAAVGARGPPHACRLPARRKRHLGPLWGRVGAVFAALRQPDDGHISNDLGRRKITHRQFSVNGCGTWVTLKSSHSATASDR